MAGGVVSNLLLFQWRNNLAADILGFPATGMEIAATGRIDRAGYITFQNNAFAALFDRWIRYRDGREKRLGVGMERHFVERFALCQFHNSSQVHHRYAV